MKSITKEHQRTAVELDHIKIGRITLQIAEAILGTFAILTCIVIVKYGDERTVIIAFWQFCLSIKRKEWP